MMGWSWGSSSRKSDHDSRAKEKDIFDRRHRDRIERLAKEQAGRRKSEDK